MEQFNKQKGAISLAEILVVVVIIGILATVILINYPAVKKQLALQRAATKLAQDIRRAQEMAMAAEEFSGSVPAGGYGIHLREVSPPQTFYVLFADIDSDRAYAPGSEKIGDDIYLESGIKIKNLDSPNVNIIFAPPDPTTYLTDGSGGDLGNQVSIEISLEDETKSKTITVNKAGLITVQ